MSSNNLFSKYGIIVFSTIILLGCKGETSLRQKFSGPRKMVRYQWIKQDSVTGAFSEKIYDSTSLGNIIFFDNGDDTYNEINLMLTAAPASWGNSFTKLSTTGSPIFWYADFKEGKSFSFFSTPQNADFTRRATYTLEVKGKTIELIGVFSDGKNNYKEVMELEEIKNADL
jgi:hypothetical protein